MSRPSNRLTARFVATVREPGLHADGQGLYLVVEPTGAKRWAFIFQQVKRRREMGLGSLDTLTLAEARAERDKARKLVAQGKNPIEERRREREAARATEARQTFREWAKEIAPAIAPTAPKGRKAWLGMMTQNVGDLADKPPAEVGVDDVLAALKPYWRSRPETGSRMRSRIERVLDAARAKGLIPPPWENPARWKGHLENLLSERTAPVKHHKALPYDEAPAFMARLRERDSMAAWALEWTILTLARTGETIFAKRGEVERIASVWTVPAERMKERRAHRVPLVERALELMDKAEHPDGMGEGDWLFPSVFRAGAPLSTAAMERIMDAMGYQGIATVHGWRSTFRDWAGDCTNFDRATIEAALSHKFGDDTELAYRRSDALQKRRKLMEAWAGYLVGRRGSVVPLSRPSA